jgi:hypothetical protein
MGFCIESQKNSAEIVSMSIRTVESGVDLGAPKRQTVTGLPFSSEFQDVTLRSSYPDHPSSFDLSGIFS